MRRILVVGAASAIAQSTARVFAERGDAFFLVARSPENAQAVADDLKVRGAAQSFSYSLDMRELDRLPAMLEMATQALGGLDTVLIAHGTLSDQKACEASAQVMLDEFNTNALSAMTLCTLLANQFETQGNGVIAVISSVAGDRGRQSNYVYGAAKATLTAFLSGMRQRLYPHGVSVITIKPGFVSTPMTAAFKKGLLWASPDKVGKAIANAMSKGTPVLYVPGFWRLIMWIIGSIPETLFRKLKL
jgi:decaprenylphospho-beta-D-erythro-pentofuranosid-2-ulose 2-reductase